MISLNFLFFSHLDDSAVAWASLKENAFKDSIPLDTIQARSWALLHQAGCHTYPHHDAGGQATIIIMRSGCKLWGIIRPENYEVASSRETLNKMVQERFVQEEEDGKLKRGYATGCKEYTMDAKPGDIM